MIIDLVILGINTSADVHLILQEIIYISIWYPRCVFMNNVFLHSAYCLVLLTCQLHTDYTVDAHSILIFGRCSVSSVRCTLYDGIYNNLYL
jgi:hypothetical protein